MAFTASFVDAQGTNFDAAYFEIQNASLNRGQEEVVSQNPEAGELVSRVSGSNQLSYQMLYWVSEQHKIDGKLPYKLANSAGVNFYANNLGTEYDGLGAEECADLHCQTHILSQMQG